MSVKKISDHKNLNLLQQVEMCFCYVYFRHTLPYHMVNCTCILHYFKQEVFPVEDLAILAYTTGTTSKHHSGRNRESY